MHQFLPSAASSAPRELAAGQEARMTVAEPLTEASEPRAGEVEDTPPLLAKLPHVDGEEEEDFLLLL